jgi:single-strand DNA-binding protein
MINMVALMGRLTYDPELRTTPSGVSVLRFQVACDRSYQKSGTERQADFIDCVAWRQTAEFISRYFHKGSMIAVEGSIQTQNYTDKNGNQRKSVEVVANNVSFCGSRNEAAAGAPAPAAPAQGGYSQPAPSYASADSSDFEEIVDDDDLPF